MLRVKIKKDIIGKYEVYDGLVQCVENGKVIWENIAVENMLNKEDARAIAQREINFLQDK